MSKLTRWLPFKFRRGQTRSQRQERGSQAEQSGSAEATFEKGVLNVRLPKTASDRPGPRRIPVKS